MTRCMDCHVEIKEGFIWCALCRFLRWLSAFPDLPYPDETA